jgi:TRAP-type C4-dicarboxylate transport system permease small subunit
MSEHGQPPDCADEAPATGLGRVAKGIEGFITPVYRWVGYASALTIGLLVVAMIYSAFGRYLGHPLNGSGDIIQYGFLIIIALALGAEHLGHEKMTVDAISKLLPKKVQAWLEPIIFLLVIGILSVAVWQLIVHGVDLVHRGEVTRGTLHLKKWPFDFLIAFGVFTVIPIYLVRFLQSIDRLVKR